jgi:hypothetical protein
VVAGLVLFAAGEIYHRQTSIYRIEVTPRHVQQLANAYALQFGARPDPQTLQQIVQRDVHDEMLYRQGLALKLDRDDQIVRRRVIQKMQFLMQDLSPPPEPTAAQLQAFYDAHAARYMTQPRATFSHIYFATDAGGDAFPDLYDFSAYEPEQVSRLFGRTPFADAVFQAPVGRWSGPYRSGYGWHLVRVDARTPAAREDLADVGYRLREDYLHDAQARANAQALARLKARYTVVRRDLGAKP